MSFQSGLGGGGGGGKEERGPIYCTEYCVHSVLSDYIENTRTWYSQDHTFFPLNDLDLLCLLRSHVAFFDLKIWESLTVSQTTNFRRFQTFNEFADDNSKFYENGRKLSKQVKTL